MQRGVAFLFLHIGTKNNIIVPMVSGGFRHEKMAKITYYLPGTGSAVA